MPTLSASRMCRKRAPPAKMAARILRRAREHAYEIPPTPFHPIQKSQKQNSENVMDRDTRSAAAAKKKAGSKADRGAPKAACYYLKALKSECVLGGGGGGERERERSRASRRDLVAPAPQLLLLS